MSSTDNLENGNEEFEEDYDDYVPLPSSLFSFSPLENYLQNLTSQVGHDIALLRKQMNRSRENAKHARMSVRQIKQYLSEKMPQLEKSHRKALALITNTGPSRPVYVSASHGSLPSGSESIGEREPDMADRTMTPLRPQSGSRVHEVSTLTPGEVDDRLIVDPLLAEDTNPPLTASESPVGGAERMTSPDLVSGSKNSTSGGKGSTSLKEFGLNSGGGVELTDLIPSDDDVDVEDEESDSGPEGFEAQQRRRQEKMAKRPPRKQSVDRRSSKGSDGNLSHNNSYTASQNREHSEGSMVRPNSAYAEKLMGMIQDLKKSVKILENKVELQQEKAAKAAEDSSSTTERLSATITELHKCEQDYLQLSRWLGLYNGQTGESVISTQSTEPGSSQPSGGMLSEQQIDSLIANSPLLLALRRIILKDVTDRIANSAETQSKDISSTVATLREEMQKFVSEEKVINIVETHGKDEVREVISEYERRLMEMELTTIRRPEFVTALKTKADAYLINQQSKVGASEMFTMEKRLHERIEELEERVAYYEAERAELREIILSLLKVENPAMEGSANKLLARRAFPAFQPRATVYSSNDERAATGSQADASAGSFSKMSDPSFQPHEVTNKPIYRLMNGDPEQRTFATLADNNNSNNSSSRRGRADVMKVSHDSEAGVRSMNSNSMNQNSRPSSSSQRNNDATPPPGAKPAKGPRGSARSGEKNENHETNRREMIGLTRNQEAYARFVTQDFNRNVVDNLPPIAYDRKNV